MGRLVAAVEWAVAELRAAEINATAEPADLNLPGVIVYPATVAPRFGEGAIEVALDLLLIARQVRTLDALDQLDELAEAVAGVLEIGELSAIMYRLSSQSADVLPAFKTTVTVQSD